MSWRAEFVERHGPGGLSGCPFGDWLRILYRVRGRIDFRYWPRAAFVTGNSLAVSTFRLWEWARYRRQIERTSVPPPLFVLGIWRSGTTHLHNLMTRDDRFAYGNTYQVLFPHTFLCTESWHASAVEPFMRATRPMDNVKNGVGEPQEDEFALVANGLSFAIGMLMFPRCDTYYRRYLTLRETTPAELAAWKSAWMTFLRKLMIKHGRPLVLKSPGHTARIKILLELFPDAKFVHIHRHPYEVFQSTIHTWRKTHPFWAMQNNVPDAERVIRDYVEVYEAFFDQRHLIPPGNYCDVAFEDLERDPIGQIRRVYQLLQLPAFEYAEPRLKEYVQSIEGYQRNHFDELPQNMRDRLACKWSRCFEEWGYPK